MISFVSNVPLDIDSFSGFQDLKGLTNGDALSFQFIRSFVESRVE